MARPLRVVKGLTPRMVDSWRGQGDPNTELRPGDEPVKQLSSMARRPSNDERKGRFQGLITTNTIPREKKRAQFYSKLRAAGKARNRGSGVTPDSFYDPEQF
jgi:hypothetical protein